MKNLYIFLYSVLFLLLFSCSESKNNLSPETFLILDKWVVKKSQVNKGNEKNLVSKYSLSNMDKLKVSTFKYHFISKEEVAITFEYIFDNEMMNKVIYETYYFDKDNMAFPILLKGKAMMGKNYTIIDNLNNR